MEKADVFATNFDPRTVERAKADYDTPSKINPKLVYCQRTGYGTLGPHKHKPSFDWAAWWARGAMMDRISAAWEDPRPRRLGLGDNLDSPAIARVIAAALFCRDRTGVGQNVGFNLYHFGVWGLSHDTGTTLNQGVNLPQTDTRTVANALWNCYQTKNVRWIMLVMPQTDRYWFSFCKARGEPEWKKEPRFDSHMKRMKENTYLILAVSEIIASKTAMEWEVIAQESDLVLGRIQTPVEVASDTQAWGSGFFTEKEYTPGVRFKLINSPIRFSKTPAIVRSLCSRTGAAHSGGSSRTWLYLV